MYSKSWGILVFACLAAGCFLCEASANWEDPGSCLLFPYYDTTGGTFSIHTITNTSYDTLDVRVVYVNGTDCRPREFWIKLTDKDTFTFMASAIFTPPPNETGFIYAYVVQQPNSEIEKKADVLVGQEIVFGIWQNPGMPKSLVNFTVNAATYQVVDLIPDGKLHLDGSEYTRAPMTLYFPRFFGQGGMFQSKMILINLTGGQFFIAYADLVLYNDAEQPFKEEIKFDCWELFPLLGLSAMTDNAFLLGTIHDPVEPVGFAAAVETGHMEITGTRAQNTLGTVTIDNASVFGVLIEAMGVLGYCMADLPFQIDHPGYHNAMLWSTDPSGT